MRYRIGFWLFDCIALEDLALVEKLSNGKVDLTFGRQVLSGQQIIFNIILKPLTAHWIFLEGLVWHFRVVSNGIRRTRYNNEISAPLATYWKSAQFASVVLGFCRNVCCKPICLYCKSVYNRIWKQLFDQRDSHLHIRQAKLSPVPSSVILSTVLNVMLNLWKTPSSIRC